MVNFIEVKQVDLGEGRTAKLADPSGYFSDRHDWLALPFVVRHLACCMAPAVLDGRVPQAELEKLLEYGGIVSSGVKKA